MYKNKSFLAIIPARGGSKGIPNKNIIEVEGKPLIAYTIEPALQSKYLDRIIVSTDSKRIAEISKTYGAEVPFLRPSNLATNEAKTIDVVIHAIDSLTETYDYVVVLQPTQPLRTTEQIDEAIEQIVDKKQESLVSVEPAEKHPILYRKIGENGELHPLLNQNSTVRRQDFAEFYVVNGLIYINKIEVLSNKTSLNDNKYGFITEPTIDIDYESDIKVFKKMINE